MGMLHSSSGKRGYDYHRSEVVDYEIPKEIMKEILILEDQMRGSHFYQEKYSQSDNLIWFRDVTKEIQEKALRDNGIPEEDLEKGLKVLNNARYDYRDDPEMNRLTIYMREDNSKAGFLFQGCDVVDVPLLDMDMNEVNLKEYYNSLQKSVTGMRRPLVVCGGSVT